MDGQLLIWMAIIALIVAQAMPEGGQHSRRALSAALVDSDALGRL